MTLFNSISKAAIALFFIFGCAVANAEDLDFHLQWAPVVFASGYRVQVSRTKDFAEIISEATVSKPEWIWTYKPGMENRKGRVFYRVASIGDEGQMGHFTEPEAIQILNPEKTAVNPVKMEPVVAQSQAEIHVEKKTLWSVSLETGYGSFSQSSSDPTLTSVKFVSPFLQEKLLARAVIDDTWIAQFETTFAGFMKTSDGYEPYQPAAETFFAKGDLIHSAKIAGAPGFVFGWGGSVERAFRWADATSQTATTQGALALGPTLSLVRNSLYSSGTDPIDAGAILTVPIGLTSVMFGADASVWSEWRILKVDSTLIGLKLEGDLRYELWSAPSSTTLTAWAAMLAPTFHFGVAERE